MGAQMFSDNSAMRGKGAKSDVGGGVNSSTVARR